jgi:hypothetical protein
VIKVEFGINEGEIDKGDDEDDSDGDEIGLVGEDELDDDDGNKRQYKLEKQKK